MVKTRLFFATLMLLSILPSDLCAQDPIEIHLKSIAESLERLVEIEDQKEMESWIELYRVTLGRLDILQERVSKIQEQQEWISRESEEMLAVIDSGTLGPDEEEATLLELEKLRERAQSLAAQLEPIRARIAQLESRRENLENTLDRRLEESESSNTSPAAAPG